MHFDEQTRDLRRSCVRLHDGLLFSPQGHDDEVFYHIEHTVASKFYRIGYPQYVFLSLLDGSTTFSTALAVSARKLGDRALTESDATQLVDWLIKNGLGVIVDDANKRSSHATESTSKQGPPQPPTWLNPFWTKVPFGSPDALLTRLTPGLSWLFHPFFLTLAVTTYGWAAITLLEHWQEFTSATQFIFVPNNWLWMLLTWVLLKVVHEFAHGIACKHYGGSVRETGLILILFAPLAYVDVTSTWRFPSRWHRIIVASAGMIVELLVASVAVLLWARADSELTGQLLYNVILMAGGTTILFNANPLMRFDGYFILSDLLEIPNLYEEGTTRFQQSCSRLFYGESTSGHSERISAVKSCFIHVYGLAASLWKVVIFASLTIGAGMMFHGAGVLLAALGVLCWFGLPVWQTLRGLRTKYFEARPSFFRAILVTAALAVGVWWLWEVAPNPVALRVPCVVDYESASHLRAETDGFVAEVFVRNGEYAVAGSPLIQLENRELEVDIIRLRADLKQSEVLARAARDEHDAAEVQLELHKQRSIRKELDDKLAQQEQLLMVAPCDGLVVAPNLRSRLGTWVEKGDDVLVIGDEQRKELVISIGHEDITDAMPHVGKPVTVRLGSRHKLPGSLKRVEPRASTNIPHAAFSASVGGPLPVEKVRDRETDDESVDFHEPRFVGVVSIVPEDAADLFSGERGWVRVGRRSESLGQWLVDRAQTWVDRRIEQE